MAAGEAQARWANRPLPTKKGWGEMGSLVRRVRHPRRSLLAVVGLVAVAVAAAGAYAAFPDTNVDTYTGCLNSGGQISNVAVGLDPRTSCGKNEQLIHLGGGDITKVTAGTGLSGGGDNGALTLSLADSFTLPQSCATGKIPKWDGSAWQCTDDQTYTNGTGLDLNGNTLSVNPDYQLPQSCASGQVAVSDGNNGWSCHSTVGGLSAYTVYSGTWDIGGFDFGDTESTFAYCNSGDIATGGGFYNDNTDIQHSEPANNGQGWYVQAHTGAFASGHFGAYVRCLHVG
jgi:hypothetical protein